MLQEVVNRDTIKKQVAVRTASEAFTRVLERLLANWGFSICNSQDQAVLLLAEEGCCEPIHGQEVIWLRPAHKLEQGRLGLPVSIESLWQALEQHFHSPPRMHMRKAVDLPARVSMRGEWYDTRLSSLSDMGTRFSSGQELVKQEQVIIELTLSDVSLQFHGQIIFSMSADFNGERVFQSGVVFHKQINTGRDDLRHYLIRQYLEAVREGMELQVFQAGLEFFDLAPEVKQPFLESD